MCICNTSKKNRRIEIQTRCLTPRQHYHLITETAEQPQVAHHPSHSMQEDVYYVLPTSSPGYIPVRNGDKKPPESKITDLDCTLVTFQVIYL